MSIHIIIISDQVSSIILMQLLLLLFQSILMTLSSYSKIVIQLLKWFGLFYCYCSFYNLPTQKMFQRYLRLGSPATILEPAIKRLSLFSQEIPRCPSIPLRSPHRSTGLLLSLTALKTIEVT